MAEKELETIAELRAENEYLKKLLDDRCNRCIASERADARKELAEKIYRRLMDKWSVFKRGAWNVNGECEWLRKEIFDCIEERENDESNIKT